MISKNALLGAFSLVPPIGVILNAAPTVDELETRIGEINAASEAFRVRVTAGEDLSDEDAEEILNAAVVDVEVEGSGLSVLVGAPSNAATGEHLGFDHKCVYVLETHVTVEGVDKGVVAGMQGHAAGRAGDFEVRNVHGAIGFDLLEHAIEIVVGGECAVDS